MRTTTASNGSGAPAGPAGSAGPAGPAGSAAAAASATGSTGHPLAWWAWGAGAAVVFTRLGNPAALALALLAVVLVALARRPVSPWERALELALGLGAAVIVVRTGFYVLLGLPDSSPVLLVLPGIDLPGWLANITLLGPVHRDGLVHAAVAGLSLAAMIVTAGAVNTVANPRRALRSLPSSLHHLGTAAVVAVSAVPHLLTAIGRIRRAQRLRGGAPTGLRAVSATVVPILAGALESALELAASMDSRGYARTATGSGRITGAALIVALLAAMAGTYGLLTATEQTVLPALLLLSGLVLAIGASVLASRAVHRTRYRPEAWGVPETLTAACGLLAAGTTWLATRWNPHLASWGPEATLTPGWAALVAVALLAGPALLPDRERP